MNALLIYPEFPDTYWSFKHALKFLGKRAAQPPLGLMTVLPCCRQLEQAPGGHQRRAPARPRPGLGRCGAAQRHAHPTRLLLALSSSAAARAGCVPLWADPSPAACLLPISRRTTWSLASPRASSATSPSTWSKALQAHLSSRRTARDGHQPPTRPEPDQDAPLLHHGGAILARLPLQLRVLRHHRDYGRRPRTKAVAQVLAELDQFTLPDGVKPCLSSTTTSSGTRPVPRSYAWRWPSGAANTRRALTSLPKLRSTWPTIRS